MHGMISSKVIVLLLMFSIVMVESRARRKRRQDPRSSAYYSSSALGAYSNIRYNLGLFGQGDNLQPIGNNWYVPGISPYGYNPQFGYNMQQYPYMPTYAVPNAFNAYGTGQYGSSGFNSPLPNSGQGYMGQSYVPSNNEWLPLPGINRRRQ